MRQSLLVATAILVIFIVSVGANVVNVNAGRSHSLQTVGPPPGGCGGEGDKSVQEWCPDHKTWKRAKVCHMGQWVPQTQDCPTETQTAQCSPEGKEEVLEHCPDGESWKKAKVCVNGAWQEQTQACTKCEEGDVEVLAKCPGTSVPHIQRVCNSKRVWDLEVIPCSGCKDHQVACQRPCPYGGGMTTPAGNCERGFECKDGQWIEFDMASSEHVGGTSPCEDIGLIEFIFTKSTLCVSSETYGSPMAPEVVYMRQVRDQMIGSTSSGRMLVNGWNAFYYTWSPPIASAIRSSETLRTIFRGVLLPLQGIIHVTDAAYTALSWAGDAASITAFATAAVLSTLIYIVGPTLLIKEAVRGLRVLRSRRRSRPTVS